MNKIFFSWVQFSRSVVSTLCDPMNRSTPGLPVRHHLLEFTQTCPLSPWCHPAILSSVVPFSSCPQSLPASESFPMSQLFAWGGQSTAASASASFFPKKSQGWSPSEWTGWISFAVQGTLKSLLQHFSSKASILRRSAFFTVQLSTVLLRLKEESISRRESVWPNYERVWKPGTKVSYFGGNGT